ncbi:MAG: nucleotide exchange factor GrpE [Dehalococcoidia bacterium]|nr:nucleotide exchange factor GrpE [Dehalococcoidia bacterium]MDW8120179.1 nucleotide exchange factor GrpE [Chloroflexota bacterium]
MENPTPSGAPQALEQEVAELRARTERLLANWQRAEADLANYRRQVEQERRELLKFASAGIVLDLLAVVDDLERALGALPPALRAFTWIEGIYLIYRRLVAVLQAHGVAEVEAEGKPFDPSCHQALREVEGEPGKVVQVVQRGYRLHGRLLRPALVLVGAGKPPPPHASAGEPPPPPQGG